MTFKLYDRTQINKEKLLYPPKAMIALLIPIVVEQLLNSFMGMVDTMMVSNVGSEAISAVSLVDSINNLVIQVFSAMATGASIICSQYIGGSNEKGANNAARQIFLTVFTISTTIMALGILFRGPILSLVFGKVEPGVMSQSLTYFLITVISYPFLALFSVGAAFFRAGGNSGFPMKISIISNIINIVGNAILIFVFDMGVAGAAISTLISRVFFAVVIFAALRKRKQIIVLTSYFTIRPDFQMISKVLAIGVPAGIENGMFQFGKLAIQSTVSSMGTAAIAAQAMTNILENVNGIFGIGVGIGLMTLVGQALGAGRKEEAKYYVVKCTLIGWVGILCSCLFVLAIVRPVLWIAHMEPESAKLCFDMVLAITIVKPIFWPLSFIPNYGLRAAGDVRFSMIVSSCTMWGIRVALCIFLVKQFGLGPIAVWYAMFTDWAVRGIIFSTRFFSGKWLQKKVI